MATQSRFTRFFKNLLLVLLIIIISVGATLYYSWQQNSKPTWAQNWGKAGAHSGEAMASPSTPSLPVVTDKPIFAALEPFTVTLNEHGRSRILYVGISLQVPDDNSRKVIQEFMPVVRDRVLHILAEQIPSRIQTSEGREDLVRSLSQGLQTPYEPSYVAPRVSNVLFTAFVIQ